MVLVLSPARVSSAIFGRKRDSKGSGSFRENVVLTCMRMSTQFACQAHGIFERSRGVFAGCDRVRDVTEGHEVPEITCIGFNESILKLESLRGKAANT